MTELNSYEQRVIADNAAAILVKVCDLVATGMPLEQAKKEAIGEYQFSMAPYNLRPIIKYVANEISADDVDKKSLSSGSDVGFKAMAKTGILDTWYNRLLWRYFGITW